MQKKKMSIGFIMIIILLAMMVPVAGASDNIQILVDNKVISSDVPPQIVDSRTMVPVRFVAEALGATVGWEQLSSTVSIVKADTSIKLVIGAKQVIKNNSAITLDVPAQIISSRTMVPIRFVSEALGCKVDWQQNTRTVVITSTPGNPQTSNPPASNPPAGSQVTGNATVSLSNTASGIGKTASVTLSGYPNAVEYKLLNTSGTALTNKVPVGSSIVVLFLNPGDSCQVEVYGSNGLLGSSTVVVK